MSFMHNLLCFFSSEDLRGELDKEEKRYDGCCDSEYLSFGHVEIQ